VVQAPTAYDLLTHLNLAKQRQRDVLDWLTDTEVFSRGQANAAFVAPLRLLVPQA
jgi:membrane peptidoglycan carboxypeptidase